MYLATLEHGSLSLNSLANSLGNLGSRIKNLQFGQTSTNAHEIQLRELSEENNHGVCLGLKFYPKYI